MYKGGKNEKRKLKEGELKKIKVKHGMEWNGMEKKMEKMEKMEIKWKNRKPGATPEHVIVQTRDVENA